jgi:hypothetical protein
LGRTVSGTDLPPLTISEAYLNSDDYGAGLTLRFPRESASTASDRAASDQFRDGLAAPDNLGGLDLHDERAGEVQRRVNEQKYEYDPAQLR